MEATTTDFTPLWSTVQNDPGGNVPALVGLLLLTWFGLDRLTNAVLFLVEYFAPGLVAGSAETSDGGRHAEQRRVILYYGVATAISFIVTAAVNVRLLGMIGVPWFSADPESLSMVTGFLARVGDNFLSALLLATGGEGLGRLLEIGGAPGAAGPSAAAPLEVDGAVRLVSEPAPETAEQ